MKIAFLLFALFLGSALSQMTYEVKGVNFEFQPKVLNISVGDTVQWTWTGNHNVAQVENETAVAPIEAGFTSGAAVEGGKFNFTFNSTGTFFYICEVHINSHDMRGQVNVFTGVEIVNGSFVPAQLQIDVDETIRFHWTTMNNIIQVENATSMTPMQGGVTSGDPTATGEWIHTFPDAGIFYFASESAGENGTVFVLQVGSPATSAPMTSAPATSAPATSKTSAPATSAPATSRNNEPTEREKDASPQMIGSFALVIAAILISMQF